MSGCPDETHCREHGCQRKCNLVTLAGHMLRSAAEACEGRSGMTSLDNYMTKYEQELFVAKSFDPLDMVEALAKLPLVPDFVIMASLGKMLLDK